MSALGHEPPERCRPGHLPAFSAPNVELIIEGIAEITEQFAYIVDAIRTMQDRGVQALEIDVAPQEAFVAEMERRSAGTVRLLGLLHDRRRDPQRGAVARLELQLPPPHGAV